jgi:hypothetical protein
MPITDQTSRTEGRCVTDWQASKRAKGSYIPGKATPVPPGHVRPKANL